MSQYRIYYPCHYVLRISQTRCSGRDHIYNGSDTEYTRRVGEAYRVRIAPILTVSSIGISRY
jgi:hypothetical protein